MNALRVGLALLLACPPAAAQELGKLADHLENTSDYTPPEDFPPELAGRVATRSGALAEVYDELAAEQPCEEEVSAEELQPGEYHSRRVTLRDLPPGCERAKVLASLAAFNREEKTPLIQAGLSNVQGRCVAYCDGPSGGGSSSGGGSYAMGSALGQLMGKAIVGLFSALGQAMADAGKARRERAPRESSSRSSWRSAPARVEAPKPPPKKPLKPTGITLSAPVSVEEGGDIPLIATLSFEGEVGTKAGFRVTVNLDDKRLEPNGELTGKTGPDGTVTFKVRARPDVEAQGREQAWADSSLAHSELDREARRLDAPEPEHAEHNRLVTAAAPIAVPAPQTRAAAPDTVRFVFSVKAAYGQSTAPAKDVQVLASRPKKCPEGYEWHDGAEAVAAPPQEPPGGAPGSAAHPDPQTVKIVEKCAMAKKICGDDEQCLEMEMGSREVSSSDCLEVWSAATGEGAQPVPSSPRPGRAIAKGRCMRSGGQAVNQATVLYARSAEPPSDKEESESERASPQTFEAVIGFLKDGAKFIKDKKSQIFDKTGGLVRAYADFDDLARRPGIRQSPDRADGIRVLELSDSTTISVRPTSSDGPDGPAPTIQVTGPKGEVCKFRYRL